MNQVFLHLRIHRINASGCGMKQPAATDDCVKLRINSRLLQRLRNPVTTEIILLVDVDKARKFLRGMTDIVHPHLLFVLIDRYLGRGGPRINNKDSHG